MDKKSRKQMSALQVRLQRLQQRLAGAKQQCDDPADVQQLKNDIAATQKAIDQLKSID